MLIDSAYGAESLWELSEIRRDQNRSRYSGISEQTTASGDSVDISDEAHKLYSEMIHKYDKSARSDNQGEESSGEQAGQGEATGQSGGSGGAGGAGESSSSDEVETLKKQIQALKSQLMALASQAGNGGAGNAAMEKMNALQSQIAALEAQLNAMEQAA